MHIHIIHVLIFICHIGTIAIIGLRHNETQKFIHDLLIEERKQFKQLEVDVTSSLHQMSVSFDTKFDENLLNIREEIELNMQVVDYLDELLEVKFHEAE